VFPSSRPSEARAGVENLKGVFPMLSFLENINGRDLLIGFGIAAAIGFGFKYLDTYLLSKAETALGMPVGSLQV
jgi:hypothetical protein